MCTGIHSNHTLLHLLKVFGNYMSLEGDQINVSFDEVVSFLRKDEAEAGGIADVPHLYLAQHELKNLPELEADVSAPLELMQEVSCGVDKLYSVYITCTLHRNV